MKRFPIGQTLLYVTLVAALLSSSVQATSLTLHQDAYTSGTVPGEAMMAINTSLSSTDAGRARFSATLLAQSDAQGDFPPTETESEVCQLVYDEETGNTYQMLSARFAEPECLGECETPMYSLKGTAFSYQVGNTKTIYDAAVTGGLSREMECVAVGEHCTVWGCREDAAADANLKISAANAQAIADKFDEACGSMVDAFGNWLDADSDGKLAIFCYDINQDYLSVSGDSFPGDQSYMGGYFHSQNLSKLGTSQYSYGMDCIHIDTFPTMGAVKSNLFSKVDDAYSTLFHEMQHLIEKSYCLTGKTEYALMPDYLNEAFSMAAEHMLFGPDEQGVKDRVRYFNCAKHNDANRSFYIPGNPLVYWNKTLSSYSNSYLFGQYLRTRYAQKTKDPTGNALFRTVLESRHAANGGDGLQIIADLLETTPQELIRDFWSAVYLKEPTGVWGFNGESWADRIEPYMATLPDGYSDYIGAGGCIFYSLPDGSAEISGSSTRLAFYAFCEAPPQLEVTDGKIVCPITDHAAEHFVGAVFDASNDKLLRLKILTPSTQNALLWEDDVIQSGKAYIKIVCLDENWKPCAEVLHFENW